MPIAVKQCRHGMMMFYTNDFYIGRSMEKYGEYSEGEIELWKQFIKPGMTVFDVGANIGCFTVYLAKAVGPRGKVYSIEPQRQIYQMLNGNLALNHLGNVSVMLGCLGDTVGTIEFPASDFLQVGNFGGVSAYQDKTSPGVRDVVPVIQLDQLAPQACHFIKIDVEGMEESVIRGATNTIAKHRPVLYVENDRKEHSASLIKTLFEIDYRCYWHLPPIYNASNYNSDAENLFPGIVSINMLCAHRDIIGTIEGMREVRTPEDNHGVGL
jgi:FkbM family methyltransferase